MTTESRVAHPTDAAVYRDSALTEQVAAYALSTRFDQLPEVAVDYAKRVLLDTVGCMVLGSSMKMGEIMRAYTDSIGGAAQATVIGGGRRVPAGLAALANGTFGHADELDSVHVYGGHMPAIAVALALAMAERLDLDGRELINGLVLTFDVGCGMLEAMGGRLALKRAQHVHSSWMFSVGAAAAASRMHRLGQLPAQHAIALAAHCMSSPLSFMDEREHMSKGMIHGQAAAAAIQGAELASFGFEATDRALEGRNGLLDVWWTDDVDVSKLTGQFGTWTITQTGFKYFSAGYPIQGPLYSALKLVREHDIRLGDIEKITVGMTTWNAETVDSRAMPSISIQDMLALGLVRGRLRYEDAHEAGATRADDVQSLSRRVELFLDRELDAAPSSENHASWLKLTTRDGRTVGGERVKPPGNWESGGMPWPDLEEKFHTLVDPRLGSAAATRAIELISTLDELDSVAELGRCLAGGTR
jgi:2-methylcitrate dehydratase PrpD